MSSTNYEGKLAPSLPLPELYHDLAPHEFIKCLKSPQRPVASSWDAMLEDGGGCEGGWGWGWGFKRDGEECGENYPGAEISDRNRNLPDPLRIPRFLKTSKAVNERRGRVFRRIQFRCLLCLAAGRFGIKLYIKYLWPLYRSPLNG